MTPEQELRYLKVVNRQLQEENNGLRRRLRENSRHARRVNQAYEDCLLMATVFLGYDRPTRDHMLALGISRRRWQNARALAKLARVWSPKKGFTVGDVVAIESALEKAKDKAIETPEAFLARIPRHGRS